MDHNYYEPFRPQLTDNPLMNIAAAAMLNQFGSASGSSFLPPSQYSNTAQLMDRINRDKLHQEMMTAMSQRPNQAFVNNFMGVATNAMAGVGKQLDPGRATAMRDLATFAQTNAATFAVQSSSGRAFNDAMGLSSHNLSSSLAMVHHRMGSAITGRSRLSAPELMEMQTGMEEYFKAGGDPLEAARRTGGLRMGKMHDVIEYTTRQGRMGSATQLVEALQDQNFKTALKSGTFSAKQLANMGLGGIEEFADADLSDPETQKQLTRAGGRIAGASQTNTARSISGIKELFEQDGIVKNTAELLDTLEQFSSQYSQQLSGHRIDQVVRQTSLAMKDFGWGMNEIAQLQVEASGIAQQHGLSAAYGTTISTGATSAVGTARRRGAFAFNVYGAMNTDQMLRAEELASARFANSAVGNTIGTLMRVADTGQFTNTEEGRRLRAISSEIAAGGNVSDTAFFNMSEAEREQLILKGSQGFTLDDIRDMRDNQKHNNAKRLNQLPNAGAVQVQAQQREAVTSLQRTMAGAAGSIGLSGDQRLLDIVTKDTITGYLSLPANVAMDQTLNPFENGRNKQLAAQQHAKLSALAAGGDKAAAKYLASLGGDKESQLRAMTLNTDKMLSRLGKDGAIENIYNMYSTGQQTGRMQTDTDTQLRSGIEAMLAANSKTSLMEAAVGLGNVLGAELDGDQYKDKKGAAVAGAGKLLNALMNEGAGKENKEALIKQHLTDSLSQYEQIAADGTAPQGVRDQAKRYAQSMKSYLANEWKSVEERRGAVDDPKGSLDKAIDSSASPEAFRAILAEIAKSGIKMSNVTINVDGVPLVESGNASAAPRGTPNTVAH